MKILYVENHARFARIVVASFLSAHDVEVQPSVATALEALASRSYDAVLVDYDLDDGKGDAVVRAAMQLTPRPRIVAVSAHDAGNAALLAAGAHASCPKLKFAEVERALQLREASEVL